MTKEPYRVTILIIAEACPKQVEPYYLYANIGASYRLISIIMNSHMDSLRNGPLTPIIVAYARDC